MRVFDGLERVHHQMEEDSLEKAMRAVGYHPLRTLERMLPGGKKLVRTDFMKN